MFFHQKITISNPIINQLRWNGPPILTIFRHFLSKKRPFLAKNRYFFLKKSKMAPPSGNLINPKIRNFSSSLVEKSRFFKNALTFSKTEILKFLLFLSKNDVFFAIFHDLSTSFDEIFRKNYDFLSKKPVFYPFLPLFWGSKFWKSTPCFLLFFNVFKKIFPNLIEPGWKTGFFEVCVLDPHFFAFFGGTTIFCKKCQFLTSFFWVKNSPFLLTPFFRWNIEKFCSANPIFGPFFYNFFQKNTTF